MKPPGKPLAFFAMLLGMAYLAICGLLYLSQRSFIYFPTPRHAGIPAFVLDGGDADVVVSTNGAEGSCAVLYFGGNAEDVSLTVGQLSRAFPGHVVYAMHYRSFGGSTGNPSEHALVADGKRLFNLVAGKRSCIVVVGRSLGSGIAIQVAAGKPVRRLVLVTPYNSILELSEQRFRLFPIGLILRDRYESWRYAPLVRAPTTLILAGRDQVIPNASSFRLANAFVPGMAKVVRIRGADHNNVSEFPEYAAALGGAAATK